MKHECEQCWGMGHVCATCIKPRRLFRGRQPKCGRCDSHAAPLPCPGTQKGKALPYGDAVAVETRQHLITFFECDCCGVRTNGESDVQPGSWVYVSRKVSPALFCDACSQLHQQMIDMALEQVFVAREQKSRGVFWVPPHERTALLAGEK